MATDVASWAPTPLSNLGECVLGNTKEWIKIEIEEIGFSMEVPVEWYDYGTILVHEERKEGAYFNATYLRIIQHLAGIEGISVLVWDAEDRTPQEFQKQLGVWLAEQDPPLNDLNYFPFFTSTVSGNPASVTYYPAQHWDPHITSPQILDAHVSIGNYFFNIRYQLRANYDPSDVFIHMLGSMQLNGLEAGTTQISKVVLCQARLNACLSQCPID